jgi:flagellar basal-body rod protein FlgC
MLPFHIALSGMAAEAKRMSVSASNVANLRSAGVDPAAASESGGGASDGYVPHKVASQSAAGGGVRAEAVPVSPPSVEAFSPGDPRADERGMIDLPNISLEEELVTQIQAQRSFEANLRVIEVQDELLGLLLDIKS